MNFFDLIYIPILYGNVEPPQSQYVTIMSCINKISTIVGYNNKNYKNFVYTTKLLIILIHKFNFLHFFNMNTIWTNNMMLKCCTTMLDQHKTNKLNFHI